MEFSYFYGQDHLYQNYDPNFDYQTLTYHNYSLQTYIDCIFQMQVFYENKIQECRQIEEANRLFYQRQLSELKQTNNSMVLKIRKLVQEKETLDETINRYELKIHNLEREKDNLYDTLALWDSKFQKREKERETLHNIIAKLEEKCNNMTFIQKSMQENLDKALRTNSRLNDENRSLRLKLTENRKSNLNLFYCLPPEIQIHILSFDPTYKEPLTKSINMASKHVKFQKILLPFIQDENAPKSYLFPFKEIERISEVCYNENETFHFTVRDNKNFEMHDFFIFENGEKAFEDFLASFFQNPMVVPSDILSEFFNISYCDVSRNKQFVDTQTLQKMWKLHDPKTRKEIYHKYLTDRSYSGMQFLKYCEPAKSYSYDKYFYEEEPYVTPYGSYNIVWTKKRTYY